MDDGKSIDNNVMAHIFEPFVHCKRYQYGHRTGTCHRVRSGEANSELARQIVTENPDDIHLLLTDVIMPGMNGWDLSVDLRAMRPEVELLFMSGYTADIITPQGG
jgi:CheY-like chemotaxis protein